MNYKKLAIAILAVFVTIFATDFIIHGNLLKGMYMDTQSLWRGQDEMQSYMGWMVLSQLLAATFFCMIFPYGREGKGMTEGVRYGLLMGGLGTSHFFMQYAVTPIPLAMIFAWTVGWVAQSVLCGLVVSKIYASEKASKRRA